MLKKMGIVVGGATLALLAVSPFAFAMNDTGSSKAPAEPNQRVNSCDFSRDDSEDAVISLLDGPAQSYNDSCVNVGDGQGNVNVVDDEDDQDVDVDVDEDEDD